jgi:hypothetical protein
MPVEGDAWISRLESLLGCEVVVDFASTYVCLGTLVACAPGFLELVDADLHDLRDSAATREIYVYDSKRFGIRRNRARVLVRWPEVVAVTRMADILES